MVRVAALRTPVHKTIEEIWMSFVPIRGLQEAEAAFRMKLGLAGSPFPRRLRRAGPVYACVVGPLHVRLGRLLWALRSPASGFSIFPDSKMVGGWALPLRPRLAASNWLWASECPPNVFLLVPAYGGRALLGRADLGTKFKDFKSTSWRLLRAKALWSGRPAVPPASGYSFT